MILKSSSTLPETTFKVSFFSEIGDEFRTDEDWGADEPKMFNLEALNAHLSDLLAKDLPLPSGVSKISTLEVLDDINLGMLDDGDSYYLLNNDENLSLCIPLFLINHEELDLPQKFYKEVDGIEGRLILDIDLVQTHLSDLYRDALPLPKGVMIWGINDAYGEVNAGIFSIENYLIAVIE